MNIDTAKESICINQLVGYKAERKTIEGVVIVPDIKPDILNIIETTGNVCIYKKEVLDGKIKIDGTLQIYIIYMADDEVGEVRSISTNLDFSETIQMPNANENINMILQTQIASIETKILNGRKVSIKGDIDFLLKLYLNENIEIIKDVEGINDIQKLTRAIEINSLVGKGYTKVFAKETIDINSEANLAEILKTDIEINNISTKLSYNKILIKADVCVKVLFITENNQISVCKSNIPAIGFIDMPNINEEQECDINIDLGNFLIKPNMEDNNSIFVEAELEICCYAFEKKNITIIEDLYSPSTSMSFKQKNIKLVGSRIKTNNLCTIKERIVAPELLENKICDVTLEPLILKQRVLRNQISYEGEIKGKLLYTNDNRTSLNKKDFSVPFKFFQETNEPSNDDEVNVKIELKTQETQINSEGALDINVDMEFVTTITKLNEVSIIYEINSDEDLKTENHSMVIYYTKPGDTIWNIAKRYGSTTDEITLINELDESSSIQVGRQLYIPRFCHKQIKQ